VTYAPFSTSAERLNDEVHDYNPGPGQYTQKGFSVSRHAASSNSFNNTVPRFGVAAHSDMTPGPGSYAPPNLWKKTRRKTSGRHRGGGGGGGSGGGVSGGGGGGVVGGSLGDGAVTWERVSQPPSIPSLHQSYGYEEAPTTGELRLQAPPEQRYSGVGYDSVGPGAYGAKRVANAQGTAWHKYRTRRDVKVKRSDAPGPGSYRRADDDTVRVKQTFSRVHNTSSFASGAGRVDINHVSADQTPAPGAYVPTSEFDRIGRRGKPEAFQFFGSSANRKLTELSAASSSDGPGRFQSRSLCQFQSLLAVAFAIKYALTLLSFVPYLTSPYLSQGPAFTTPRRRRWPSVAFVNSIITRLAFAIS
jgi:hypothetical protein